MEPSLALRWQVAGTSVRGASHRRLGLPNQDAVRWHAGANGSLPVVLAVSDGHGSPRSFRSDEGARLAVVKAVELAADFAVRTHGQSLSVLKADAERQLPAAIVREWRAAASIHLEQHPFTTEELSAVERQAGASARQALEREGGHLVAYGATLLLAVLTEAYALFLQLGDGDMLVVWESGGTIGRPIVPDPCLIANETTSLCMDRAQYLFRVRFQVLRGTSPRLMLVATDGYANSFATEADFISVPTDIIALIDNRGWPYVEANLAAWLEKASSEGSGDDVTVGLIGQRGNDAQTAPGTEGDCAVLGDGLMPELPEVLSAEEPVTGDFRAL